MYLWRRELIGGARGSDIEKATRKKCESNGAENGREAQEAVMA